MFLLLHGSCQTKKQVLWPLDNVYLPILWGDSSYYGHFYTTSLSIVFHVLWVYFTWFLASFFVIINMLEFLINIFYFQFCNELTVIGISILILYAFSQVGMLSLFFPLWVLQLINWFFFVFLLTKIFVSRVRFHYGHPDIFDRLFHLTRGGVSKASKIINLSEDIFAGMPLFPLPPIIV